VVAQVAERAWSVVVPHQPAAAGTARTKLANQLSTVIPADLLADVVSVAAELVGNAIQHAAPLYGGVIRLSWRVRNTREIQLVEVRVTDGGGATEPRVLEAGQDATEGRGLAIVAALTSAWGVEHDGPEQTVWAELTRPHRR
jgi:anti-sigma regulatory factor (Ser/Thr protein kinase)